LTTISSRVDFTGDVGFAAFYLRELGTYSDDGAAYITSRRAATSDRPSEAIV
jgi:hypothetical protein